MNDTTETYCKETGYAIQRLHLVSQLSPNLGYDSEESQRRTEEWVGRVANRPGPNRDLAREVLAHMRASTGPFWLPNSGG